ncbi:MAG: CBS domain-containing protein [Candidatus Jordarchaeaceae archaeon]
MKVADIMVENVVKISAEETVDKAVRLMNRCEIGCLVVTKNSHVVGIITERDLLRRVLAKSKDPRKVKVSQVMTKPVIVGSPLMELEDAARMMFRKKIKKLPLVNDGKLVGLITLTDIARTAHIDIKMLSIIKELSSNGWLPPKRMQKVIDFYVT